MTGSSLDADRHARNLLLEKLGDRYVARDGQEVSSRVVPVGQL